MVGDKDTPSAGGSRPSSNREPRSYAGYIAAFFVLALVGWMGSGYVDPEQAAAPQAPPARNEKPFTVEAFESEAKPVTEFVSAEGQVTPDRTTPVRAKVGGTVEKLFAHKGDYLDEGAPVAQIALDDRAAQKAQAQAELQMRQNEFDRVSQLANKGYTTTSQVEAARASLASAKAAVAAIDQTTGNTMITAPIAGVLDDFDLDLGEFVTANDEVGKQIDNDPLTVDVEIAQQNVGRIKRGQPAAVTFITGEERRGEVTYIAANAKSATRTFPVEITVANPDSAIPAGISAQVKIPTGKISAHFVSAAILALGPNGELGVKAADADGKVSFYPVDLVRAETDGIWVSGLPDKLDIISVGQGFVSAGETVSVKNKPEDANGSVASPDAQGSPVASSGDGSSGNGDGRQVASLIPDTAPGGSAAALAKQLPDGLGSGDSADRMNEAAKAILASGGDPASLPGWSVELLQTRLNDLGYAAGTADGVVGQSTRSAIRAFQRDQGVEPTGDLSPSLAAALLTASPPESALAGGGQ